MRRCLLLVAVLLLVFNSVGWLVMWNALRQSNPHNPSNPETSRQQSQTWPEWTVSSDSLTLTDTGYWSELVNLPELLAGDVPPRALAFAGPTERHIEVGSRLPGTDIQLLAIGPEGAEFQIADRRSIRRISDSLVYDGLVSGVPGAHYKLQLRIFYVGSDSIRAVGFHRLIIEDVNPETSEVVLPAETLTFPFATTVAIGSRIPGATLGYAGRHAEGAQLFGLDDDEYPYRNMGDSILWQGEIRPGVTAHYNLRVVYFNDEVLQPAGFVTVGVASSDE